MNSLLITFMLFLKFQSHIHALDPNLVESKLLPCDFLDSYNITKGVLFTNKSILFDGVEYAEDHYAKINYLISRGIKHIVNPHVRGCLCELRPCIRFCCPHGSYLAIDAHGGGYCRADNDFRNLDADILDHFDEIKRIKLDEHFAMVLGFPCKQIFIPGEQFHIKHTGQILLEDGVVFNHRNSCFLAEEKFYTDSESVSLNLATCSENKAWKEMHSNSSMTLDRIILTFSMMLSVVFIIATLTVYGCIPKIRHLNEKCLMCYLVVLAITFTLLSLSEFNNMENIHSILCLSVGYTLHFSVLSSFSWLNVINFDLWLSFQSTSGFKKLGERMQFIWYMIYGYGLPSTLTLIIIILDRIESIPYHLRPGMGVVGCFPLNGFLPELLFFYLPATVLITSNIVLFILTVKRLRQVQIEANRPRGETLQEQDQNLQKALNKKRENFMLYFRLFIVAGVSWSMEIIWFVIPINNTVYFIADLFNSLQGVFIFVLFVIKPRVLSLIKKRWGEIRGQPDRNESTISKTNEAEDYLRLNSVASP